VFQKDAKPIAAQPELSKLNNRDELVGAKSFSS
jgi:hypothetical protein